MRVRYCVDDEREKKVGSVMNKCTLQTELAWCVAMVV